MFQPNALIQWETKQRRRDSCVLWISVVVVLVTTVREQVCLESQPKTMELGAFGLGLDSDSIYLGLWC